ncbi:hypothetical protein C1646_754472 [Rhizophagus diaphanus]|nr:hypothetical protein C1646_754472 [Rhizophagus diaphanus] [Rhizophagus sp. MUCL 43196]
MKDNENEMNNVIQYLDSIVTTINPDMYAPIPERHPLAFTEIFNQILNKSDSEENSLTSIQKLLLNSITERDISAQEICHLLLGIPLYHSSQQYILLNINEEAPRCVQGTGSRGIVEDSTTIKEGARTTRSPLRKILPRPSGLRNRDQWAEFCHVKVILHVPHRSIKELNGDDDIPWSTIYEQHIDTINSNPIDVLEQAFDEEPEISEEESYDEIEEEEEDEKYRYDWMHLAEMEEAIANASEFVRQAASNNNNIISERDNGIEYQNLNKKQKNL